MADVLVAKVIDPLSDNIELSDYANKLSVEARTRYAVKLLYDFGQCILPDPYFLKSGWEDDPSHWPAIEYPDIWTYLIESPCAYTRETLKAYTSLDAYRFVVSGHVQVVESHPVSDESLFCALRAKVTPSKRVTEKPHQPWVYLDKRNASVYYAYCIYMAGLGEVVEPCGSSAFQNGLRLGLTEQLATSRACGIKPFVNSWNLSQLQNSSTELKGRGVNLYRLLCHLEKTSYLRFMFYSR